MCCRIRGASSRTLCSRVSRVADRLSTGSLERTAIGCCLSSVLYLAAVRFCRPRSTCCIGGIDASLHKLVHRVVFHAGRIALHAWFRTTWSFLAVCLPSRFRTGMCRTMSEVGPGSHASAPYSSLAMTHAMSACLTARELDPFIVLQKPRRCCTVRLAAATRSCTWRAKLSWGPNQTPNQRMASPQRTSRSPCRTQGRFPGRVLRFPTKCMISVLMKSKVNALASPHS